MSTELDRPHVWLPGTGATPLLLLHGTGGDENDLVPLREHLAPDAPVLSVRGSVLENGMPRFFRRLREGVFDEDDLRIRVDELASFVAAAEQEYGVVPGAWTAVGFSNGANIASALLFGHPAALAGAVLLAAMVPYRDGPPRADLTGKRVLLSNGRRDPMATADHTTTLTDQLRSAGADVTLLPHDGGHGIDAHLLPRISEWIARPAGPPRQCRAGNPDDGSSPAGRRNVRRSAPGVVSSRARITWVRCSWWANPQVVAISAIVRSDVRSRRWARSRRRRIR